MNPRLFYVKHIIEKGNMKKTLLITMMCCLVTMSVRAQWSFGVKAGLNFSSMSNPLNKMFDTNNRLGPMVGTMTNLQLSSCFDLQGELYYARRGFKTDIYVDFDDNPHNWNFSYHYINLPILLKYHPFGKMLFLEAGPQLGYLLDDSNKIENYDEAVKNEFDSNKIDFGLVGGIGADLSRHFSVDMRYYLGLTNNMEKPEKGKNRSLEVSVGYWF